MTDGSGKAFAQAIQLGLWALGRRQHERSLRRSLWLGNSSRENLAQESLAEIAPWECITYPGRIRAFAELLGVRPSTGRRYLAPGGARLPPKHAVRLADFLDEKQKRIADLVLRLREYAAREGPPSRQRMMQNVFKAQAAARAAYVRKVRARQELQAWVSADPDQLDP